MKKYIAYILSAIVLLASIVSLWFLLPIGSLYYSFPIFLIATLFLTMRIFFPKILNKLSIPTKMGGRTIFLLCLTIVIISLLVKFFIFSHFDYSPISDPRRFFRAAQAIADGIGIKNLVSYALFPFQVAYANSLSIVMRIINNDWLAVIVLNSIFDILSAIIAFWFVRDITSHNSIAPLVAFTLWLLSPFNLLYSTISLPLIAVNFFIIATVYIAYLMVKEIHQKNIKKLLAYSVALGVVIGIGNCFRPVFTIFLIALPMYLLYITIANKDNKKFIATISGTTLLIILSLFFAIQTVNTSLVSYQTGLTAARNTGGWSIFVGANYKYGGIYNQLDNQFLEGLLKEYVPQDNLPALHTRLSKEGLERYKQFGIIKSLKLFGVKLYKFASNQNSVNNIKTSIVGYKDSTLAELFNLYILVFTTSLFATSAYYLYTQAKAALSNSKQFKPIILFVSLVIIGFFFSSMLVEVSNRYAQIMYPLFIIAGSLLIDIRKEKNL